MSGALDRLHYEKDPCVRYDALRKVWIYLHRGRTEEDFGMHGIKYKEVKLIYEATKVCGKIYTLIFFGNLWILYCTMYELQRGSIGLVK